MSNINNNANKKHSYDRKTSSRVTPKIREYLAEIANEREVDLERFMILSSSSPASSGVSVGAQSFNKEATTTKTRMRSSSSCCGSRTHSRASGLGVGVQAAVTGKNNREDEEIKITNIPIVMEKEQPKKANSVEDLRTPTKCTQTDMAIETEKKTETRKTQTPESALKSHKRLEWDPAADVGYQLSCERAVSTSNISTLERSVLEAATTLQRPNQSETDLVRLKGTTKGATKTAPPLASSTLVNRSASNQTQMAPLPNSSSLARSRRESCATSAASSFDYHHNNNSRPSTAGNSNSTTSTRHSLSAEELLRHMEQQRQEREYSAQLEQVLSRRRQGANKENQQPKKQNKSKNSVNHSVGSSSSSSTSSCAPAKNDLDLGIDLLCSLVNKRSLSQSQKKQLAKDIIKRLVGFEMISSSRSSTRNSSNNNNNSNRHSSQHKEQSQQTEQNQARGKDIATNNSRRSSLILPRSISPPAEQLHHLVVPVPAPRTRLVATPNGTSPVAATCSYASTSSGASNDLVTQKTNPPADKRKSTDAAEQLAMQEYLNPMTQSEIEYEQKRQQRDNLSMERRTQIDWIDAEIRRLSALQNLLRRSGRGDSVAEQGQDEEEVEVQREMGQRLTTAGGEHPGPPAPPVTPVFMEGEPKEGAAVGVEGRIADGRTSSEASSGTGGVTGAGTGTTSSGASSGAAAPSAASTGAGTATGASSGAGGATGVQLVAAAASGARRDSSGATSGAGAGAATGTKRPSSVAGAGKAPSGATAATGAPPLPPALPTAAAAAAVVAPAVRLRSKMATPTLSHSGSSESVCSFVQQRQRQFLAHYQNQQQQRREQQQQLFMLQQQQQLIHRQQQQQQQQQHLHAACHMSQQRQPHCHHHHQQQHQQHYVQMQYAQALGNSYSCLDDGAVYYHVLSSQGVKDVATATAATTTAATATKATTVATVAAGIMGNSCNSTNSSSSLLCLSSEMSIPMGGMLNAREATTTTTTTTTTHQYDDVACQQIHLQLQQQQQQQQHQYEQQPMEIKQQMLQMRPRGIAYMLQFTSNSDNVGRVLHESLTVQDYLQLARPQFCAQSKQRKAILNQMQLLRNARRRELDQLILIEGNSLETIDRQLQQLPPPVTSKVRIFSTKEMKALTNKRCENLPEVLAAQNREREERRRRSNRIMRDVFNRRLQRRVRSGKLSLNHSRTVI